jgi:hypothetical protein
MHVKISALGELVEEGVQSERSGLHGSLVGVGSACLSGRLRVGSSHGKREEGK